MRFPKLKHPRLCRLLSYIVVLGVFLIPIPVITVLPLPDIIKVPAILGLILGVVIYIIKNFMVLMGMDMMLASLSCQQTARTVYRLPKGRSMEAIRRSILRYGNGYEPKPGCFPPSALRYKHSNSLSIYAKGIERVVAAYEVDHLDEQQYRIIFSSAKANSLFLEGKKRSIITDPSQKNAPLHRVTVILILAHKVDPKLTPELYDLVCKRCGDEDKNCFIPCVVDMEQHTCVFNCLRLPYVGFEYAVKNRGIRIVKHQVFGGNLNLRGNTHTLKMKDEDMFSPEDTLWDLWGYLHQEFFGSPKENKRKIEALKDKEITVKGDTLYLKWDQRAVCLSVKENGDKKTVRVEPVEHWFYPKKRPVGKKIIRQIEESIVSYYHARGFEVAFIDPDIGAVFACSHILDEKQPILFVRRDADGDWQFLCSNKTHRQDSLRLVTIFDILDDPSAADAIALEPGQTAMRNSTSEEWTIKP